MSDVLRKIFVVALAFLLTPFPEIVAQTVINQDRYEDDKMILERLQRYEGGVLQHTSGRLYIKPVMTRDVEGREIPLRPEQVYEWTKTMEAQTDYNYSEKTQKVIAHVAQGSNGFGGERFPEWTKMRGIAWDSFNNFVNGNGFTGMLFGNPELDYIRAQARDCTANHHRFADNVYPSLDKHYNEFKTNWDAVANDNTISGVVKKKKLLDDTVQMFIELNEGAEIAQYIKRNYGVVPVNCPVFRTSWNWDSVQNYLDNIKNDVEPKAKQLLSDVDDFERKLSQAHEQLNAGYEDVCLNIDLLNVHLHDFQYSASFNENQLRARFLAKDLGLFHGQLKQMSDAAQDYGLYQLKTAFDDKIKEVLEYQRFVKQYTGDLSLDEMANVDESRRYFLGSQGETKAYSFKSLFDSNVFKNATNAYESMVSGNGDLDFSSFENMMSAYFDENSANTDMEEIHWSPGDDYVGSFERQMYCYEFKDEQKNMHMRIGLTETSPESAEGMVLSRVVRHADEQLIVASYKNDQGSSMIVEFNELAAQKLLENYHARFSDKYPLEFSETRLRAIEASTQFLEQQELEEEIPLLKTVASFIVDCIPIVGLVKSFIEFGAGLDPVTGESLGRLETGIALVASFIPIPGSKYVGKALGKILSKVGDFGGIIHQGFKKSTKNNVKGHLGEAAAKETMERAGYKSLPCKLKSNNGFDGVYVKYKDGTNDVVDTIIVESKASSSGTARLADTKTMGKQMSDEWIDANIEKMRKFGALDVQETAKLISKNSDKVRKKMNILTPDGTNRWRNL